jgi:hypothetical protein
VILLQEVDRETHAEDTGNALHENQSEGDTLQSCPAVTLQSAHLLDASQPGLQSLAQAGALLTKESTDQKTVNKKESQH